MKHLKSILSILLLVSLVLSLSACGSVKNTSGPTLSFAGDSASSSFDSIAVNSIESSAASKKSDGGIESLIEGTKETFSESESILTPPEIFYDDSDSQIWHDPNAEAFILTAAEWNDNDNWGFFRNLVNNGTINYPQFGLNPMNRIKVTVTDDSGKPVANEKVLLMASDNVIFRSVTDKNGIAYTFYNNETPTSIVVNEELYELGITTVDDQQGSDYTAVEDIEITLNKQNKIVGTQIMFIVDTTGSMGDEITYLQKDFSSIVDEIKGSNLEYSVNFYKDTDDRYVTSCNDFTPSVKNVQQKLNAEYAEGGGDFPEAVAQILAETITQNTSWKDDCNKIAFMIFDAPPHDGTDATIKDAIDVAAARGIRLIPVVSSGSDRDTELFARAMAIYTNGTYVFLTDDSGVGGSHLEPIVGDYEVDLLHNIIVNIINRYIVQ